MNSTIPGTLTALAAIFAAAAPDGFQIGEGTLLQTEDDFLIVGYDDGEQPAVTGSRFVADQGMGQNGESYDISNLLSAWIGDADTAAARTRLFDLFDVFDDALTAAGHAAEPIAPGVGRALVTGFEFLQPISDTGSTATLRFLIHVDAWRTP